MIITDLTYRDVLREKLRGGFRTIFRLEQICCALRVVYPHPVTTTVLGNGDHPAWAKEVIRKTVDRDRADEGFLTLRFELKEIRLNDPDGEIATRIFDGAGRILALDSPHPIPCRGLEPESCAFQLGEIVQVLLHDRLEPGIVQELPMTPREVDFHNQRMIDSPLLELRGLDDPRTIRERMGKLPVCDQTDATYGVLHDPGDDDEGHYPADRLARPLGAVPPEGRTRLQDRRRFEEGCVVIYATEGLPPEDYFRLGINDCWIAELTEPYVLVYDFHAHAAVALDDLRWLKGSVCDRRNPPQPGLPRHKLKAARPLIAANRDRMRADFQAMPWLKQNGCRKEYRITASGQFVLDHEYTPSPIRWP